MKKTTLLSLVAILSPATQSTKLRTMWPFPYQPVMNGALQQARSIKLRRKVILVLQYHT